MHSYIHMNDHQMARPSWVDFDVSPHMNRNESEQMQTTECEREKKRNGEIRLGKKSAIWTDSIHFSV